VSQVLDFQSRAGLRPAPVNQVHKKKAPQKDLRSLSPRTLVTRRWREHDAGRSVWHDFPEAGAYHDYAPASSLLRGSDGTHVGQGRFLQGSPMAAGMSLLPGDGVSRRVINNRRGIACYTGAYLHLNRGKMASRSDHGGFGIRAGVCSKNGTRVCPV